MYLPKVAIPSTTKTIIEIHETTMTARRNFTAVFRSTRCCLWTKVAERYEKITVKICMQHK